MNSHLNRNSGDHHFSKIFSTKIDCNNFLSFDFINDIVSNLGDDLNNLNNIIQNFHECTFFKLGYVYESIIQAVQSEKEIEISHPEYLLIIGKITDFMLDDINNPEYHLSQKAILTFIFVNSYINQGRLAITKSQELLDDLFTEIEQSDELNIQDFNIIFNSIYSIIGFQLLDLTSDFITRRNLVASILAKFNYEKLLLEKDDLLLIENDMHPLLIDIILRGYSSLYQMLVNHAYEIPEGEKRNQLIQIARKCSILLQNTIFTFLEFQFKIPSNLGTDRFLLKLENIDYYPLFKDRLIELLLHSLKYTISLVPDILDDAHFQNRFDICLGLTKNIKVKSKAWLFEVDLLLRIGRYPFEAILQKIEDEVKTDGSIILSSTFEEEIMKPINAVLQDQNKLYSSSEAIDIETFEILCYFAGEWLQALSISELLFHEGLMILSALNTISYAQLTRAYYQTDSIEKAFLMYQNFSFFTEYTSEKIKQLSRLKPVNHKFSNEEMNKKFYAMIKEYSFEKVVNIDQIKEVATKIENSILKKPSSESRSMMGMLSEEIVFGYMDLIKDLESFIETITEASFSFLNLHESSIYLTPRSSYLRFDQIGKFCLKLSKQELPFPLIRNIHEMAVALSIFPLKINVHEIFKQQSTYQSINEITSIGHIPDDENN